MYYKKGYPKKRKTQPKKRKIKVVKKVLSKDLKVKVLKVNKEIVTKYPPLTSEAERVKTRKQQNALNRARSKSMENRVAKVLGGRRVLMSGAAAAYKGDVEVIFKNNPSGYIVECKLSAQSKENEPYINIQFKWLPKMHQEAINMGVRFCILIINFLGNTRDYVFVREDIVQKVIHKYESPFNDILTAMWEESNTLDLRTTKTGKKKVGHSLDRSVLENSMKTIKGMKATRLIMPDGVYLVMHIDAWALITKEF